MATAAKPSAFEDSEASDAATTRPPTSSGPTRPSTYDPRGGRSAGSAGVGGIFDGVGALDEEEASLLDAGVELPPGQVKLVRDAHTRIEEQKLTKGTLLELCSALEEQVKQRRLWAQAVQHERQLKAEWQVKCAGLEQRLVDEQEKQESLQAELIVFRGFEKGNKVFIGMMLERARYAYESPVFESIARSQSSEDLEEGGAAAEVVSRPRSCPSFDQVVSTSVDKLLFKWIFRLWKRECRPRPVEQQQVIVQEAPREIPREIMPQQEVKYITNDDHWKKMLEEQEKRLREEMERRLAQLRKEIEQLQKQLEQALAQGDTTALKARIAQLEKQLDIAKAEALEIEKRHLLVEEQLRGEIVKVQQALAESQLEVKKVKQEFEQAAEAWRRIQATFDGEKRRLQNDIKSLSAELKTALVLSKYMREALIKAKRDAMFKVSPEKLAELIEQLELMKETLDRMRRDYQCVRDERTELLEQLDTNRRRFELERQFLPLIHRTQGPLGPKFKSPPEGKQDEDGSSVADSAADGDALSKLQRSMSAVSVGGR